MKPFVAFVLVLISAANLPAQPPKAGAPSANPGRKLGDPSADALYFRVITKTGSHNKQAGTILSWIDVSFNGDPDYKVRLANGADPNQKPFQRGQRDVFEGLFVEMDPAEITSVRVSNDSHDMWKCESISFQFFRKGEESQVYKFTPDVYLSKGKGKKGFASKQSIDLKLKVKLGPKKPAKEDKSDKDG